MRVIRCKHTGCHELVPKDVFFCQAHIGERPAYMERREKWKKRNPARQRKYNQVIRYRGERGSREQFYHSRAWKRLRQQALERDHYQCQYCKERQIVRTGTIVDHIVPIQVDKTRASDLTNLATCCKRCHEQKTRWEQRYYGTGYDRDGKEKVKKEAEKIATVMETVECVWGV